MTQASRLCLYFRTRDMRRSKRMLGTKDCVFAATEQLGRTEVCLTNLSGASAENEHIQDARLELLSAGPKLDCNLICSTSTYACIYNTKQPMSLRNISVISQVIRIVACWLR